MVKHAYNSHQNCSIIIKWWPTIELLYFHHALDGWLGHVQLSVLLTLTLDQMTICNVRRVAHGEPTNDYYPIQFPSVLVSALCIGSVSPTQVVGFWQIRLKKLNEWIFYLNSLKAHLCSMYVRKCIRPFQRMLPSLLTYFHASFTLVWMLTNTSTRGQHRVKSLWQQQTQKQTWWLWRRYW